MTIKDIAAMTGVSTATVSRYLNGGSISKATRERIRQVMDQTGYTPDGAGQMLRTGHQNLIGVIVPYIDQDASAQLVAGISEVLAETRYLPLLGHCSGSSQQELAILETMQANHVSGIILAGTYMTPSHEEAFLRCSVPLVVTGQRFSGVNCVYHDDFHACYDLARQMLQTGKKHLAFISSRLRSDARILFGIRGAQAALDAAGYQGSLMPHVQGGGSIEAGRALLKTLLEDHPETDGILCSNDLLAVGVLQELAEMGASVPGDVAVAGQGFHRATQLMKPRLTTVQYYHHECGSETARMLLQLMESNRPGPVRQLMEGYTIINGDTIGEPTELPRKDRNLAYMP